MLPFGLYTAIKKDRLSTVKMFYCNIPRDSCLPNKMFQVAVLRASKKVMRFLLRSTKISVTRQTFNKMVDKKYSKAIKKYYTAHPELIAHPNIVDAALKFGNYHLAHYLLTLGIFPAAEETNRIKDGSVVTYYIPVLLIYGYYDPHKPSYVIKLCKIYRSPKEYKMTFDAILPYITPEYIHEYTMLLRNINYILPHMEFIEYLHDNDIDYSEITKVVAPCNNGRILAYALHNGLLLTMLSHLTRDEFVAACDDFRPEIFAAFVDMCPGACIDDRIMIHLKNYKNPPKGKAHSHNALCDVEIHFA